METFSTLLRSCISEGREARNAREVLEGAGVLVLGMGCSIATAYLLAALGLAV
jgi:hypothetical protein